MVEGGSQRALSILNRLELSDVTKRSVPPSESTLRTTIIDHNPTLNTSRFLDKLAAHLYDSAHPFSLGQLDSPWAGASPSAKTLQSVASRTGRPLSTQLFRAITIQKPSDADKDVISAAEDLGQETLRSFKTLTTLLTLGGTTIRLLVLAFLRYFGEGTIEAVLSWKEGLVPLSMEELRDISSRSQRYRGVCLLWLKAKDVSVICWARLECHADYPLKCTAGPDHHSGTASWLTRSERSSQQCQQGFQGQA